MVTPEQIAALVASAYPLLHSSSSSETDSELEELLLLSCARDPAPKMRRLKNFVDDVVDEYSDAEFRQHFHINRTTAEVIITTFEASAFYTNNEGVGRKNIPARHQILAFLWFCANTNSYREIGKLFNLADSTFFKCLNNILDFFHEYSKAAIRFPASKVGLAKIATSFKTIAGIENVVGCINCCYFRIRGFTNRDAECHDFLLMALQGICDSKGRFLDVCVGSPSRIPKSKVFALSPISSQLSGVCRGRYHLLGDGAYPLRDFLITPYLNKEHLTTMQKKFNLAHRRTRNKMEHAFGTLKQRFRKLTRLDFFNVDRMCKFILACCTLHNLCIDIGDKWEEDKVNCRYRTGFVGESSKPPKTSMRYKIRNSTLRRLGVLKRKALCRKLYYLK